MKTTALTARRYGRPDVLEYVTFDMPDLARDTARIEVKAAGINPVDARRMTGELRFGELPLLFGTEYAGTIVALNADDGEWTVGDEVLGAGGDFTHATIIDVPIANLVRRPPSLSWEVAGSLAGAAQTALTILDELGPVSSLLVHGGAGGVGSITIQLAREQGFAVVATGSDANQSYLRSLGAIPVVYGPGLVERLGQAHAGLFDASIDMAGSQEATEASLARVKPDGVIGSITATRPTSPRVIPIMRRRDPTLVERVATGIASSALRWEISATHDFKDARAAYEAILGRHVRGKSVLTF
ncbi:NADP-dependent oxidoreductase [Sphingomonas sp. PB4P5]|uniref:NADP-dependent oxidoreductase n=1 Tax=Parasphingomonas puruogangriensis TaxID=3096155 RepID=UPI002FC74A07